MKSFLILTKKIRLLLIFTFLVFYTIQVNAFVVSPLAIDTFYVDGINGDDTNDGSALSPFQTIQKAIDETVDGVGTLIIVESFSPPYLENIILNKSNVEIDGLDFANNVALTISIEASDIIIRNITFQGNIGGGPTLNGIKNTPGISNIQLHTVVVVFQQTGGAVGALFDDVNGLSITNGNFQLSDSTGLLIKNSANITLSNFTALGNGNNGFDGFGVQLVNCSNVVMSNITAGGNSIDGIALEEIQGGNITDASVSSNTRYGLSLDASDDVTITGGTFNQNDDGVHIHPHGTGKEITNFTFTGTVTANDNTKRGIVVMTDADNDVIAPVFNGSFNLDDNGEGGLYIRGSVANGNFSGFDFNGDGTNYGVLITGIGLVPANNSPTIININNSSFTGFTGGGAPPSDYAITLSDGGTHNSEENVLASTNIMFPGASSQAEIDAQIYDINDDPLLGEVLLTTPTIFAPTLLTPANNSTNLSIVQTFTWSSVAGALDYLYELATHPSFSVPVNSQTVAGTSVSNVTLAGGTTYYWRVTANGVTDSATSLVFTFTTQAAPGQPVLVYPIDNDQHVASTPTFVWSPTGPAADSFRIQITPDPTFWFVQISDYIVGDTTFTLSTPLSHGSPFYWRVRGYNSGGAGMYSFIDTFKVSISGDSTPPVPYPSYPANNLVVYTTDVNFYWYTLFDPTGLTFDFEFSEDGTFTGVPDTAGLTALTYSLSGLINGETYYWKVRSNRTGIYSEWSDSALFSIVEANPPTVPIASWPIGGNIIYTSNPILYWYLNSESTGLTFDVEFSSTLPLTGTPTYADLSASNQPVTGLNAAETYYWSVRSKSSIDSSAWSPVDSFTIVASGIAEKPIVSWPKGGNTVYSNSPGVAWYQYGYTTGLTYEVNYGISLPLSGSPQLTGITDNDTILAGLNFGTTYYWAVRSNDGSTTSPWSDVESFFVVGATGSAVPILSWPKGGATVYSTTQNLNWHLNGPYIGLTFEVEYNTDYSFSGTPNVTGITAGSYTLNALTPGETYHWRVRSYNGNSHSPWSSVESFNVYAGFAPSRVFPGDPQGGISINTDAAIMSWYSITASSAKDYELQYATSPDFSDGVTIENLSSTSYELHGLINGNHYYWRVRGKTQENEYSAYSTTASFVFNGVTGSDDSEVTPLEFKVEQNYPNPFNPSTTIKFSIPEASYVSLKIYDMLGREVKTLLNSDVNPGNYSVQWFGDNNYGKQVASGTYIYRVVSGSNFQSMKMLFLK